MGSKGMHSFSSAVVWAGVVEILLGPMLYQSCRRVGTTALTWLTAGCCTGQRSDSTNKARQVKAKVVTNGTSDRSK